MNILLINPPCGPHTIGLKHVARIGPLGLEILAAALPERFRVRIVDMEVNPQDLDRTLREFRPDVAGTTCEVVHVSPAKVALRRVRAAAPRCLTVVGGHHPTVWPQDFLDAAIDIVVRGEGVESFREICTARAEGATSYDHIAGIMIRDGGVLVPTKARPLPLTLDYQPTPRRPAGSGLPSMPPGRRKNTTPPTMTLRAWAAPGLGWRRC
ncbi:MAG: radical SAM protein [Alphaproteobacteria bacterium]